MSAAAKRCLNCFKENSEVPCHHCGWIPDSPTRPPFIPVGTVLNDCYQIGRVLGHGGFGITYQGWDTNLDLPIAIKEYYPRKLATRVGSSLSLSVYTRQERNRFEDGLHDFQEEAKILAKFQGNPNIVGVYRFFHANNTCYMVMEYVSGVTLYAYLKHKGRLNYEMTFKVLSPVMKALKSVHEVGLLHRDVSPHNIYITKDNKVKLLDFGAARSFNRIGDEEGLVIVKPGYAPQEQYQARGNQGPWTDVYGLSATFYHCLTAEPPPVADERAEHDTLKPPSEYEGVDIPPAAEQALIKGLAVEVADRFQDIDSFRSALPKQKNTVEKAAEAPVPAQTTAPKVEQPVPKQPALKQPVPKNNLTKVIIGAVLLAALVLVFLTVYQ